MLDRARPATGHRRRPARAHQGQRRRRRPRHAHRPRPRRLAGEVEAARAEAAERLRRPHRVLRALPRHRPAHRGPGHGRPARHRLGRRRARVLDPAPPPEGRRGGARHRWSNASTACAKELFDAARAAAAAIDYTGAGTVEFLADDGRAVLLPRDEHPPAGRAPGHRVHDRPRPRRPAARGRRRRRLDPEPPRPHGAAIEVRLYAEDPAADWQPQSGTLRRIAIPGVDVEFDLGTKTAGLRLDSGVVDGSVVGIHYDPMLAKVIAWAPDRTQAATALAAALARARDPRRRHQPRPARQRPAPSGVPARRDRHRVLRPARPRHPRRATRRRRRDPRLGPRRRPRRRRGRARRRPVLRRRPVRLAQRRQPAAARVAFDGCTTSPTGSPATGCEPTDSTTSRSSRPRPTDVVLDVAGVRRTFAVARHDDASTSTPRSGR